MSSSRSASPPSSRAAGSSASTRPTDLLPVAPAQHYASGGVRTDLLGRSSARRPLRLRRGLLHGGARRQPAGLQLAARGTGLRPPHRRRHQRAAGAPASCRCRAPGAPRGAAALLDGSARVQVQAAMTDGCRGGAVGRAALAATASRPADLALAGDADEPGPAVVGDHQPPARRPGAHPGRLAARGDPRRPRPQRLHRARRPAVARAHRCSSAARDGRVTTTFEPVAEQDLT